MTARVLVTGAAGFLGRHVARRLRAEGFEPVAHVSTHGALLREQMLVPLIVDGPVARAPQRTADVMPSVLDALGVPVPGGLDGRSFW